MHDVSDMKDKLNDFKQFVKLFVSRKVFAEHDNRLFIQESCF